MFCLGLNHKTSPVAVRERFSVPKRCLEQKNAQLAALPSVQECVLLSTCNRTELYYWTAAPQQAQAEIMSCFGGAPASEAGSACFYLYSQEAALRHLARVAAGMDSMLVGETEIFGQIKDAYRAAHAACATAAGANRTFQKIFTIAKKVRTNTKITSGPTSIGAAAVQLASEAFGGLAGSNVLVVGAGDMARSTARSLISRGAESIFVANRSYDRAVELAERVGGRVIRFAEWIPYLEQIDIVIVSTASPVYVVSPRVLQSVQAARASRPLFLIDLSVPRNVDPACAALDGVFVHDMDTLQTMADASQHGRHSELMRAQEIIDAWLDDAAEDLLHRKMPPFSQKNNTSE